MGACFLILCNEGTDLIRKFFDLGDVLIVLEVVEDFEESLEEQCSFTILPFRTRLTMLKTL